jgi:hypothetical protein
MYRKVLLLFSLVWHRNDIDNHLNNVDTDLDTLKDLLRGEGYQFDANSLLGVSI